MKAWHKDGSPSEHPEPWGSPGVFTTTRVIDNRKIPFFKAYLHRLLESASRIQMPWIPDVYEIEVKVEEFLMEMNSDHQILRICLFENLLGFSSRMSISDGNPVDGWLMHYRRPDPTIKSTLEKELYGKLAELDISKEDWIIIDPKDNDIRETATSNLIFAQGEKLIIPEKRILKGIVLQKLLPFLVDRYAVTRGIPKDQDISSFNEIILCGTGRGVAPLSSLSEVGWSSRGNEIFSVIRSHYEEMIQSYGA